MDIMSIIWLVAMVALAVIEAATLGLTSIWFAFGSLIALLASVFGLPEWLQVALFVISSAALVLFVRPISQKYLKIGREKTNADRMVSMHGVVTQKIDNTTIGGQVKVNGQIWTAQSADDSVIEEGAEVKVKEIRGVKLIVEKN